MTEYRCPIIVGRVIDGDTIVAADVDLGYRVHRHDVTYRVLGVDCPEVHGATKQAGLEAREFTSLWLVEHRSFHGGLMAWSVKEDSFGRWLAEIYCVQGEHSLSVDLLRSGHAAPFVR